MPFNQEVKWIYGFKTDPIRMAVWSTIGTREKPSYESKIAKLKPDEIGYQKVLSLLQDNKKVKVAVTGTILKVLLNEPVKPGQKTTLEMDFEAQVPVMGGGQEGTVLEKVWLCPYGTMVSQISRIRF